jgi:polar amino acid transport system substrate-binding protein
MVGTVFGILFFFFWGLAGVEASPGSGQQAAPLVPGFWDPNLHLDRPDLSGLRAIRFLTEDDNPPLNFALSDGEIAGFNVDIARAICRELQIACTIQARRWDTMADSLIAGKGDAVIASLASGPAVRARVGFTQPYYQTPARFVIVRGSRLPDVSSVGLAGKRIGVVAGSAHRAYIETFFPLAMAIPYPDAIALREALRRQDIDALFGDGLALSVWLAGTSSADCCEFIGGPYTESKYFGEGVGIAVRNEDVELRRALDWALAQLWARGTYEEIFLKHFPISFY